VQPDRFLTKNSTLFPHQKLCHAKHGRNPLLFFLDAKYRSKIDRQAKKYSPAGVGVYTDEILFIF
jgi:hypothetical protein